VLYLRCSVLLLGAASAAPALPVPQDEPPSCSVAGTLVLRPLKSRIFRNSRLLRVWMPPGYDTPAKRQRRYPEAAMRIPLSLTKPDIAAFAKHRPRKVQRIGTAIIGSEISEGCWSWAERRAEEKRQTK
jgi:hypothetical protein